MCQEGIALGRVEKELLHDGAADAVSIQKEGKMRKRLLIGVGGILILLMFLIPILSIEPQRGIYAQSTVYGEKQLVLDWLSQPKVVEYFGKVSDAPYGPTRSSVCRSSSPRL